MNFQKWELFSGSPGIRTSLRTLQAAINGNSHLIKNLFRLSKKNLGSFMRVSTVIKRA